MGPQGWSYETCQTWKSEASVALTSILEMLHQPLCCPQPSSCLSGNKWEIAAVLCTVKTSFHFSMLAVILGMLRGWKEGKH